MTSISPSAGLSSGTGTAKATGLGSEMGKDTFLKLLVAQLQQQDPLKPTDDQNFLGQMAQFTMVEQVTNLAALTEQTRVSQSISYIGRTVTYLDELNQPVSGVVDKVDLGDGKITLTVGGKSGVDLARVTEVK